MIGSVSFALIVVPRAISDPDRRVVLQGQAARYGQLAALFLLPVLLSRLFLQLDSMRFPGDPLAQSLGPLMNDTLWGTAWKMLLVGALVGNLGLKVARVKGRREFFFMAVVAVLVVTMTLPLSGHAASVETYGTIAIAADFLHVLGAGTWLGTLGVMLVVALGRWSLDDGDTRVAEREALVRTFSPFALACVGIVAASGFLSAILHIHSINELVSSAYGRMLLFKLVAVGNVLLFGYFNWKRNTDLIATDRGASIQKGVIKELVAAVLVLLITSALVVTPPP